MLDSLILLSGLVLFSNKAPVKNAKINVLQIECQNKVTYADKRMAETDSNGVYKIYFKRKNCKIKYRVMWCDTTSQLYYETYHEGIVTKDTSIQDIISLNKKDYVQVTFTKGRKKLRVADEEDALKEIRKIYGLEGFRFINTHCPLKNGVSKQTIWLSQSFCDFKIYIPPNLTPDFETYKFAKLKYKVTKQDAKMLLKSGADPFKYKNRYFGIYPITQNTNATESPFNSLYLGYKMIIIPGDLVNISKSIEISFCQADTRPRKYFISPIFKRFFFRLMYH